MDKRRVQSLLVQAAFFVTKEAEELRRPIERNRAQREDVAAVNDRFAAELNRYAASLN